MAQGQNWADGYCSSTVDDYASEDQTDDCVAQGQNWVYDYCSSTVDDCVSEDQTEFMTRLLYLL